MRRWTLGLLFACGVLAAQQADPKATMDALLPRLDSDDAATREAAQAELDLFVEENFETAGNLLRVRQEGASAEARQRIQTELDYIAQVEALKKRLEVFDGLDLPNVPGKTFVVFNTGGACYYGGGREMRFQYALGWILSESEGEITLLENTLGVQTYKRAHALPEDWEKYKDAHPKDAPLPGDRVEVDYADFCKKYVAADVQSYFGALEHFSGGGMPHGVEAHLYARWAMQRKMWRCAIELAALGEKSIGQEQAQSLQKGSPRTIEETLADSIASNLRWRVINEANAGTARTDLLATWKRIGGLPPHEWTAEANGMVGAYESLLAEDEAWRDIEPDALSKLPPEEQATYWMHRLRDHDAMQMMQPGECDVLGGWGRQDDSPNPADRLVELGWDAIPVVIAHLDDTRPTRCVGYWRNFAIDSYYLLRYADCCQQVFEAIAGVDIYDRSSTSGSMVRDGMAPRAKLAAEAWWEENGGAGREGYFARILESKETARHPFAAEALLKLDATKYLPRAMEAAKRPDASRRAELLDVMCDLLGKEHRAWIAEFLSDRQPDVAVSAARCLWKACGSDEGAAEVVKRLKALPVEDDRSFLLHGGVGLLVTIGGDAGVGGICELMRESPKRVRYQAISDSYRLPDPRVAEGLVALFDDDTDTGWTSSFSIRICDQAAQSLTRMLTTLGPPEPATQDEERDAKVAEMKSWWTEHKSAIDWTALRAARK